MGNLEQPELGTVAAAAVRRTRRIAVVAIHGVADQKLGDTAQALADLLVAQAPNGSRYEQGNRTDETFQVQMLEPLTPIGKTPDNLVKELRQSIGSDFLRNNATADGVKQELGGRRTGLSLGAEFSDYLLAKAKQNDTPADAFTAPRIRLTRSNSGGTDSVEVWEMYWADLSRLAGSVPRILTELFTLLFRFSTLGRDTVQLQAAVPGFSQHPAWRALQSSQTALDWAYSRVLATLYLQPIMLALLVIPFATALSDARAIHTLASILGGIALTLVVLYYKQNLSIGLIAGLAVGFCLWNSPSAWVVGLTWIAIISILYDWGMRICEQRFRMVRKVGWILWAVSIAVVVSLAVASPSDDLAMWITGAVRALEIDLLLITMWWVFFTPLTCVWFLSGMLANKAASATDSSFQARSSVATGRTALVVSVCLLTLLGFASWGFVAGNVEDAMGSIQYSPVIFISPLTVAGDAPAPGLTTAADFVVRQLSTYARSFYLIGLLPLLLAGWLVIVLLPSIWAEFKSTMTNSTRLGLWLTGGYRRIESISTAVVLISVVLLTLATLSLLAVRLGLTNPYFVRILRGYFTLVMTLAGASSAVAVVDSMVRAGKGAAGVSAGSSLLSRLSAGGGTLSKYVRALRAPLDAALDVDNHFREFPRQAIPRARIFSRYVAVLERLAVEDYERIIIVSHSQGTVISAELLRYLKERAANATRLQKFDRVAALWPRFAGRMALITAGCPLRQLYAARFPVMYGWVLEQHGETLGPTVADLGVEFWVNVYTTGDYVGRWLWSRSVRTKDYPVSQIDQSATSGTDTYVPEDFVTTNRRTLMGSSTEKDISIGAGAHTRYFEKDQKTMAGIVDALIAP
jgi:hypothetical protein